MDNKKIKNQENDMHMLRYLEKKQEVSQREIAQHLGISLGKVNYILNAFMFNYLSHNTCNFTSINDDIIWPFYINIFIYIII